VSVISNPCNSSHFRERIRRAHCFWERPFGRAYRVKSKLGFVKPWAPRADAERDALERQRKADANTPNRGRRRATEQTTRQGASRSSPTSVQHIMQDKATPLGHWRGCPERVSWLSRPAHWESALGWIRGRQARMARLLAHKGVAWLRGRCPSGRFTSVGERPPWHWHGLVDAIAEDEVQHGGVVRHLGWGHVTTYPAGMGEMRLRLACSSPGSGYHTACHRAESKAGTALRTWGCGCSCGCGCCCWAAVRSCDSFTDRLATCRPHFPTRWSVSRHNNKAPGLLSRIAVGGTPNTLVLQYRSKAASYRGSGSQRTCSAYACTRVTRGSRRAWKASSALGTSPPASRNAAPR
jgi:hypothetical protein